MRALLRVACCLAAWPLPVLAQDLSSLSPAKAPVIRWDDGVSSSTLVSATYDPDGFPGARPADANWSVREAWVNGGGGAVDRYSMARGSALPGVPGTPLWLPPGTETFDINYTRGWPSALSASGGGYAVDFTPHAGLGFTSAGASAEGGATVRFGGERALERFGVEPGGVFGSQSRWYLYAAASGRAIGYNFLRTEDGWRRSGMSLDEGAYIGDAQAGVAWRKGDLQASFGYVDRIIKMSGFRELSGDRRDSVVAFTVSMKHFR